MLGVSIRFGPLNVTRGLRDNEGVSILYITHDLASARYVADRMIVIYAGRVVEEGRPDEVIGAVQYPYTRLLMSSAPDPHLAPSAFEGDDLGEAPKVVNPGPGCRFAPRCPPSWRSAFWARPRWSRCPRRATPPVTPRSSSGSGPRPATANPGRARGDADLDFTDSRLRRERLAHWSAGPLPRRRSDVVNV